MPRYHDDYDFGRPRVSRRRKRGNGLAASAPVVVLLGIAGLLILLSCVIRGAGIVLMWAGVALIAAGYLWFYLVALADGIGQLLLCLFVPFYSLFYLVMNWEETKYPFGLNLLGIFVAMGCLLGGAVRDMMGGKGETPKEIAVQGQGMPPAMPPLANPPSEPRKENRSPAPNIPPPKAEWPDGIDPVAKQADKTLYLGAMTPTAYKPGPWKYAVGATGAGAETPIKVQGKEYKWGLSAHPPNSTTESCFISYAPGGGFKRLKGWAALNGYAAAPGGKISFAVWGDGRKLWESDPLDKSGAAIGFDIDVTGVKSLTLETRVKEGSHLHAHAVWLDPWLER